MNSVVDSFWRAAAYCLHPRVIGLSILPVLVMGLLALAFGYWFWAAAVEAVRTAMASWTVLAVPIGWLERFGLANLSDALAPLVVVALGTPLIVVMALFSVAVLMTPAMLALVARRRFADLEKKGGGSFAGSVWGGLWATALALLAMLVSIPLWFVPPLVLIVPPLIWGWLTYRVMTYDVLADHASREERFELVERHRARLLGMGVLTGYLGAAPALVFASGALTIGLAPVLIPLAVWIYTLVFAFSALWFAHFGLAALQSLRDERPGKPATVETIKALV